MKKFSDYVSESSDAGKIVIVGFFDHKDQHKLKDFLNKMYSYIRGIGGQIYNRTVTRSVVELVFTVESDFSDMKQQKQFLSETSHITKLATNFDLYELD